MTTREPDAAVLVVGAGHAGLATAVVLARHGLPSVVLERGDQIGASWRRRYEALRLNTERWGSALPGMRIPRTAGRWPSAAEFADYLERYAARHGVRLRFGVEVKQVDPDPAGGCQLSTSEGLWRAPAVVLATGPDEVPRMPGWPGLAGFTGTVLHAHDYRTAEPFAGARVLVAGGGESGAGIACDLVRGGAAKVWLSVRTPPYITRPDFLGIPSQALAILARGQPAWLFDANAALMRRAGVGDLSGYGLRRPPGLHHSARVRGKAPILDRGFTDLVRRGEIEVVDAVAALDRGEVVLAGGARLGADAVVAATGYAPNLGPLVGHLGLAGDDGRPVVHGGRTHPQAPDLYFVGYTPVLSGNIREAGRTATRVARAVRNRQRERR
ncbi:MAG TPA: NAD(P)/FAD-dependent oxidoreductase [Micromonosporaceae bacterium]|nr:NAD(P)/FAD-dependent oxidoreductase [Micromonosporaceae bacterium]